MTMTGERNSSDDYLELRPEKASCFDLIRILCSNEFGKCDFFNSNAEERVTGFRHRWILFISIFLQKIFVSLKKPVGLVGKVVELLLNFPQFNGGYIQLFINLMTGRLVKPDKSSARFLSVVGNVDKRIELTRNGDTQYNNPSLAIMASKISYENEAFVKNVVTNHWQMKFLEFNNFWNDFEELNSTNSIMFQDNKLGTKLIVIAFRGTEPFNVDAWKTDVDLSWYKFHGVGKIHGGFIKALGLQKSMNFPKELPADSNRKLFAYYSIREKLKNLIRENKDTKFILTGHSLGGALAILFAAVLTIHKEELLLQKLEGVYTFGQPRVGDEEFGEYMKKKMILYNVKYFRYVYCNDIVPRLPYDDETFMFKHFGPCLYFNSCYKGQVLEEEPNKNYFSLPHVVPKIENACFELMRSFMLPWRKGKYYREGWLMILFRVTTLFVPGLTNHCPLEYVNATRLGNLPYQLQLDTSICSNVIYSSEQ